MLHTTTYTFTTLILAVLMSTVLPAQELDYQLRIVGHTQLVKKGNRVGLAAWVVFPDVMNEHSLRALLLGGVVYKRERRWIEFMAGGLFSGNELAGFELDLRYSDRSLKWINAFLETEYNFGTRKLFVQPSAAVPVRIARIRAGIGAESDFVFAPGNRLAVAGPRLVLPLPVCRRFCRDFSLITAYRFQSDGRRVLRQYLAFTF